MKVAAVVAVVLLGGVAVFQLALAAGAPLGKAAWGGQHERALPPRLRAASGVAGTVVYPLIVFVVLEAAGWIQEGDLLPGDGSLVIWILAVVFAIGSIANFASRSRVERLWGPISLAIAICCGIVASGLNGA